MVTQSPTLYRLAANRQYEAIPDRVQSHPLDLIYVDRYGSTALHILCQARSDDRSRERLWLKAVDAILAVAPEQVAWSNAATWTPLHFAVEKRCSVSSTTLALKLIQACPSAVGKATRNGFKTKTPFHIACEANADYRVLEAMLEVQPRLAAKPLIPADMYVVSENPLEMIWKHPRSSAKMALLLRAIAPNQSLLHAACSVQCPRDFLTRLLQKHPELVSQRDPTGRVPLHVALKHANADNVVYTQYLVESLLEVDPTTASIPDPEGRLPLHIALGHDLTWHKGGVSTLVYAYPDALAQLDPVANLYPFCMADRFGKLYLSTTYELLRAAPSLL